MVSALASFVVWQAVLGVPVQDEARDWEFRAGRWETLAGVLSQELGQPVRVNERIRDEVVFGRFSDKTASEMMAEFSASTLTSWTEEGGAIVIRPDGRAREEREKAVLQREAAILQKSIDKALSEEITARTYDKVLEEAKSYQKAYQETGEYDWERIQKLEQYSPATRLAYLFLQNVSRTELAQIKGGQSVVFATSPTSLQRPLGRLGDQLLAEFKKLNGWHSEAMAGFEPEGGVYLNILYNAHRLDPSHLCIGVTRSSAGFNVEVTVYSHDSAQTGNSHVMLFYDEEETEELVREFGNDYSKISVSPKNPFGEFQGKVKMSGEDRIFSVATQLNIRDGDDRKELVREALVALSQCLENDPGSYGVSNLMFSLSRQSGKDVSGFLPDMVLSAYFGTSQEERSVAETLFFFMMMPQYFDESESSYRFHLMDMEGMNSISNRRLIAAMATAALKPGGWSIDELASAALLAKNSAEFLSAYGTIRALTAGRSLQNYEYTMGLNKDAYATLRLYGLFSQSMRSKARTEAVQVGYAGLSTAGKKVVLDTLLGQGEHRRAQVQVLAYPVYDPETREHGIPDQGLAERYQAMQEKYGAVLAELTFFLAISEALPVTLELTTGSQSRLFAQNSDEWGSMSGSIESIMRSYVQNAMAHEQGQTEYMRPFHAFSVFSQDLIEVKVKIGEFWLARYVMDWPTEMIPDPAGRDKLPEDVRKRMAELEQRYREEMKDWRFGGSGGGQRQVTPP